MQKIYRKQYLQIEQDRVYKEIDNFKKNETDTLEKTLKGLQTSKEVDDARLKKHQEELVNIKQDYVKHKDETIQFLVESLLDVDLVVPDVVIGKFAAKVLGKTV